MSVFEDLRSLESRLTARLDELRPLVDEYHELEQLAKRLGVEKQRSAQKAPTAAPSRPAARSRPAGQARPRRKAAAGAATGTKTRARPGRKPQRRQQVLDLVRASPGITVPDIGKQLGVDPTGLYRVVRQLEREGAITKSGMALTVAQ